MSGLTYDPRRNSYLCFAAARDAFIAGQDTPRAYLESCLERIASDDQKIKAFVCLNIDHARQQCDAATKRYRDGRPLSSVDGLPVAVKDCYETTDMPTEINSPLFTGWQSDRDAAHVLALRRGGAAIVGKTVTTELTMARPGPTWNPWDLTRTPGGSSSGSGAAVAAKMLPAATGSQNRGSTIRPASICGIIGMKPTFGAVNRGGGFETNPSCNHYGILSGTLTDAWEITHYIAQTVGGDPGHPGLFGEAQLPAALRPVRLARQYTYGWELTDAASREAFEDFLKQLSLEGMEIVDPSASAEFHAYEEATRKTPEFFFDLGAWERRWPLLDYGERRPEALSPAVHEALKRTQTMTLEEYRRALARRDELRSLHRSLEPKVDAFITLAHIGPGQKGMVERGTPWYNDASSAIGAPTFNLPLLVVEGVPLGIQIMGFEHKDERLAALARWILEKFGSRSHGYI